jgi:two-component system OmpR family response regulator
MTDRFGPQNPPRGAVLSAPAECSAGAGRRGLEAIREMVTEALTDAGYLTATRPSGAGLEDVLEGFRPNLVVLDVMMPDRDGFVLIDVVRD